MTDTIRTRIAAVLKSYGLSDQYGDPLPEEELSDVADAVIRELEPMAETITDAVETVLLRHDFHASSGKCSCGAVNNMDGDVLDLHRISLVGAAVREALGVSDD